MSITSLFHVPYTNAATGITTGNKLGGMGSGTMAAGKPDPVKEFMDYMQKSPAERMVDNWLKAKGISREEFDALPAEEKEKLLAELKEEIKRKMEEYAGMTTGGIADVLA